MDVSVDNYSFVEKTPEARKQADDKSHSEQIALIALINFMFSSAHKGQEKSQRLFSCCLLNKDQKHVRKQNVGSVVQWFRIFNVDKAANHLIPAGK